MKLLNNRHYSYFFASLLALIATVSASALANEVYSWTDQNGVVHYGDMPPEGWTAEDVEIIELSQAGSNGGSASGDTEGPIITQGAIDPIPEDTPPETLTPAQALREKLARDREKNRQARAEMEHNCRLHRERLAKIEPHRRVFESNEAGEMVRLDDEQRIARVNESKAYIAQHCK